MPVQGRQMTCGALSTISSRSLRSNRQPNTREDCRLYSRMNPKYSVALVLALQVSLSLAQFPEPDKELSDKLNNLQRNFEVRLSNVLIKMNHDAYTVVNQLTNGQAHAIEQNFAKTLDSFLEKTQLKNFVFYTAMLASGIVHDAGRRVQKASIVGLGLYGRYLHHYMGTHLDEAINHMNAVLEYLPTN